MTFPSNIETIDITTGEVIDYLSVKELTILYDSIAHSYVNYDSEAYEIVKKLRRIVESNELANRINSTA